MKSPLNRLRTPPQTSAPPPPLYLVKPAAEVELVLLGHEDGGGTGTAILTPAHSPSDGPIDVLRLLEDDRGAGGGGPSVRINRPAIDVPPEDASHDTEADVEPPPPPPEPRYHRHEADDRPVPEPEPEPEPSPEVSDTPAPSDVAPDASDAPEGDVPDDEGSFESGASEAPMAEPPGVLKMRVGSRHARIFVGGAFVPSANGLAELTVAPGTYSLEVQAAGKVTSRGTIRVAAGKVTNVVVPLKPTSQWGTLIVGVAMMGIAYGLWKSGLSVHEEEDSPATEPAIATDRRGRPRT